MRATAAGLLLLALAGCAPAGDGLLPAGTPVVLVVIDTLRADHLGCYGHGLDTSPVLDALARRAFLFEQNASPCNATFASLTSIMTGLFPATHGHYLPVPPEDATDRPGGAPGAAGGEALAERLADAGYHTVAVLSHPAFGRPSPTQALGRGWSSFSSLPAEGQDDLRRRLAVRADETNARAFAELERWRQEAGGRPLFLWVHYFDPHTPYDPPYELRNRFLAEHLEAAGLGARFDEIARLGVQQREHHVNQLVHDGEPDARALRLAVMTALYDAEIAHCDAQLGQLFGRLDELGVLERALVVVTADHGENMEPDEAGHGPINFSHQRLFEAVARTPLLLRLPGQEQGRRIPALVQGVDILPTLVELLGLPPGAACEGRSLVPLLTGAAGSVHEQVFSEDSLRRETALKTEQLKVIHQGDGEPPLVFAWPRDPSEREDVTERVPPRERERLLSLLEAFRARARVLSGEIDASALDPLQLETLRALGYVK